MRKLALIAASLTLVGGVAHAQDYTLPPAFGEVTLVSGFTPDPYSIAIVAGGTIDASQTTNASCRGYIANAPDYRLHYTSGSYPLHIAFVGGGDTTLVINGPNGQWYCDDDSLGNLNPLVNFTTPSSGQYDIWVGTYSSTGTDPNGTLFITELDPANLGNNNPTPTPTPNPPAAAAPNPNLPPTFGETTVQAGLPTQPVQLTAGGTIDAYNFNNSCAGYIAEAPDYVINFQTLAGILPLVISVTSQADTTLVVMDPAGNWLCNDDTNNLDPEIRVTGPTAGAYKIWVGTYGNETASATLNISTLQVPGTK